MPHLQKFKLTGYSEERHVAFAGDREQTRTADQASPKLIIPGQLPNSVRASAIAAASVAVKLRPLPPQMTCLPGPAAMRASKANPTTMIKSPPAPHFADQNHTTVPRTTSKLLPLAAPTHHDQLFPFGRSTLSQGGCNAFAPRRPFPARAGKFVTL